LSRTEESCENIKGVVPNPIKELGVCGDVFFASANSSFASQYKGKVDVRPLKSLVFAKFPKNSPIYDILLAEKDLLEQSEFLAKADVWLKLLRRYSH
jgi:hypothetical protein